MHEIAEYSPGCILSDDDWPSPSCCVAHTFPYQYLAGPYSEFFYYHKSCSTHSWPCPPFADFRNIMAKHELSLVKYARAIKDSPREIFNRNLFLTTICFALTGSSKGMLSVNNVDYQVVRGSSLFRRMGRGLRCCYNPSGIVRPDV